MRRFTLGNIQILSHVFFNQKKLKYFNDFQNQQYLSFMTKVNPNNGNKIKSDIFPWDIFKYDII